MTGDLMPATEAERIGLINHVVEPEELDARVDAFADKLANGATKAIRWTKTLANLELRRIVGAVMDPGVAYEALSNNTADHREAVEAFLAKRQPVFTGK